MMYAIGWIISFAISRFYIGVKIFGRCNVPKKGAFIFAANHASNADPFILGTSFFRPLEFLAKEELFRHPFSRWVFTGFHAHPVKRGNGDYRALKETFKILQSGKPLLIFPEGTRSKNGSLQPGKPGIGFMVYRLKVPVVPVYIEGSREAMPEGMDTLKRHPVRIYIGKPMHFDSFWNSEKSKDIYQEISDLIMARIASLKDEYEGCAS